MYTQCPECESAFRVTAAVLRKAAGMVRCGSCGHAFNSLDFLSEEKPEPAEREAEIPELVPEPNEQSAELRGRLPRRMSAAQSAALLKTLDQLAGEDIRIEDTGVEWRVLGDDDDETDTSDELLEDPEVASAYHLEADDEPEPETETSADSSGVWILEDVNQFDDPEATVVEDAEMFGDRATAVDELLDDNPTPVDELLEESPAEIDAADLFQSGSHDSPDIDDAEVFDSAPDAATEEASRAEMRFDDNTPLPDDFHDADEAPESSPQATHSQPVEAPPDNGLQAELALGNPDEWQQLLNEFEELIPEAPEKELNGEPAGERGDDAEPSVAEAPADTAPIEAEAEAEAPADTSPIEAEAGPEDEAVMLEVSLDEDDALDLEEMLAPDEEGLIDEGEQDRETNDEGLPKLVAIGNEDEAAKREDGHYVPPMTEEEETINMLIDQDLLAIAQVDDDGFASTIVVEKGKAAVNVESVIIGDAEDSAGLEDEPDDETQAEDAEPSVILPAAAESTEDDDSPARKFGIPAAVAALALALLAQVVHQQRENLATIPAAGGILAPVYEAIGSPITPNWDVGAWDIARTRGATDDNEALLTIFSEIRNTSDKALPYPIVTLSLTDRYQDPVGALVLEPADYLAADADLAARIEPGGQFEATIPIDSPSAEAVGYTINACYRRPDGDLRCAVDDFK